MNLLAPEISRLLEPQERLNRIRDKALHHGGRSFVDLAYANSYDGPTPETITALQRALDAPHALALQYTPFGGATIPRRLVAEALRKSHGQPFQLKDVILTPGAMAALNIVFRAVKGTTFGDEVIVITPCWLDYPTYLENLGLVARFVPVDPVTLRLDHAAIRAALSPRTKALILSQPSNPAGLIYTEDELRELGSVLRSVEPAPLLISDECHRDLVFDDNRFVSPCSFYETSCTIYSLGKILALQGQRYGYVAVSPSHPDRTELAHTLEQLTRVMGFCTPTAHMQLATADLLRIPAPIGTIAPRRKRAMELLSAAGYELVPSQATFFIYPRAPGGDADRFADALASKGVVVLPASVFHHHGHFRISLTIGGDLLEHGLATLAAFLPEYLEQLH